MIVKLCGCPSLWCLHLRSGLRRHFYLIGEDIAAKFVGVPTKALIAIGTACQAPRPCRNRRVQLADEPDQATRRWRP